MPIRDGEKFDIHQLPECAVISGRTNIALFECIAQNTKGLRDKLALAEQVRDRIASEKGIAQKNPSQLIVTEIVCGKNNKKNYVPTDFEMKHSEKIQKEKRRLAGYAE